MSELTAVSMATPGRNRRIMGAMSVLGVVIFLGIIGFVVNLISEVNKG